MSNETIVIGTCPDCGYSPTQSVAAEFTDSGLLENWHVRSDFTKHGWSRDVEAEARCVEVQKSKFEES